ncbi:MAG: patatin-like phospholipase family protein [Syntrophaceae bacterium]
MTKKKKIITGIALQGGGALGAYEFGALKALYAYRGEGFTPRVVAGISIGAINAALLTGAKQDPIGTLEEVWRERFCMDDPVCGAMDMFRPWCPKPAHSCFDFYEQNLSLYGNPGMYRVNPRLFFSPLSCTNLYDTSVMEKTFREYADVEKLNRPDKTRLIVTAVNVRTGEQTKFDNARMPLGFKHIMASGSFPVSFPMTEIDGEFYWDGGIFINTPLAPTINALEQVEADDPDIERELFYVEVHRKSGELPCNLKESYERCYNMIFSGKFSLDGKLAANIESLIDFFAMLEDKLPEDSPLRQHKAYKGMSRHKKINRLITVGQAGKGAGGSSTDFSRATIERRIEDGFNDAMEALYKAG